MCLRDWRAEKDRLFGRGLARSMAGKRRATPQEIVEISRQLNVAQRRLITVDDTRGRVHICFTPTIPHCSMATLIGLCIRVKLLRSLPRRFKVTVMITPGAHSSELAVNKQLADKEREHARLKDSEAEKKQLGDRRAQISELLTASQARMSALKDEDAPLNAKLKAKKDRKEARRAKQGAALVG